jgi:hypothetical protein
VSALSAVLVIEDITPDTIRELTPLKELKKVKSLDLAPLTQILQ